MTKIFLLLILVLSLKTSFSQNYKGIYINNFHLILGNEEKEDSLYDYLRTNNFTSIALYNLHQLDFSSSTQMNNLRNFISGARSEANIIDVTATAENAWFFENKILPFNLASNANEMMNVFNLEFEFWVPSAVSDYYCTAYLQDNGYSCDESGAFDFYMRELSTIDSITTIYSWTSEIYLGWFNQNQADQMKSKADRILLSNYQSNPNNCFDVSLQRLQYLGNSSPSVDVAGLFSSEDDFLHSWLLQNENNIDSVYSIFNGEYQDENGNWKSNINLLGQHWFTYSTMGYQLGTASVKNNMEKPIGKIYPNLVHESITIELEAYAEIFIYNAQSQLIKSICLDGKSNKIDLKSLEAGIYFIKTGSFVQKIIKA